MVQTIYIHKKISSRGYRLDDVNLYNTLNKCEEVVHPYILNYWEKKNTISKSKTNFSTQIFEI